MHVEERDWMLRVRVGGMGMEVVRERVEGEGTHIHRMVEEEGTHVHGEERRLNVAV